MIVDVLPNVPKLAVDWLLTQVTLTSLVGQRVSTRSPASVVYPYVTLQRIGGIPAVPQRLDSARLQVDCWADTEGSASRVARVCRAALHAMEGYTTADAIVTGIEDDLGLSWLPDTTRTPPTPRFIFGCVATAHALP